MNKVSQRCSLDYLRGALVCRPAAMASGGNPVATARSLDCGESGGHCTESGAGTSTSWGGDSCLWPLL